MKNMADFYSCEKLKYAQENVNKTGRGAMITPSKYVCNTINRWLIQRSLSLKFFI